MLIDIDRAFSMHEVDGFQRGRRDDYDSIVPDLEDGAMGYNACFVATELTARSGRDEIGGMESDWKATNGEDRMGHEEIHRSRD